MRNLRKCPRKGQETRSGEKKRRRGTRRDEPRTRNRRKGPRPKQTLRLGRAREKKKSTKEKGRNQDRKNKTQREQVWRDTGTRRDIPGTENP